MGVHIVLCLYVSLVISITWSALNKNEWGPILRETGIRMFYFILAMSVLGTLTYLIGQ